VESPYIVIGPIFCHDSPLRQYFLKKLAILVEFPAYNQCHPPFCQNIL